MTAEVGEVGRAPALAPVSHLACLALFVAALAAAPLVFGAYPPFAWVGLLVALTLAFALGLLGDVQGQGVMSVARPPLARWLVPVVAVLALQLVPLPRAVLGLVSPGAAEAIQGALPDGGAWQAASLDRGATVESIFLALLYALGFVLAARVARVPRHAGVVLTLLLLMGAFEAFYGLAEQIAGDGRVLFWSKPVDAPGSRALGTFPNPNHYAAFLGMGLPVAVGLGATLGGSGPALPREHGRALLVFVTQPDFPKRVILLFVAAVLTAGLAGSVSRGGLLGAVAGLVVIGVAIRRQAIGGRWLLLIGGAAVVLLAFAVFGVDRVLERFATKSLMTRDVLLEDRVVMTRDTLTMAARHPLLGVGAGAFYPVYPSYRTLPGVALVPHAHDDYAQLLAELGFVGGGALLLGLGLTARRIWVAAREQTAERAFLALTALAALAPITVHSLFDFSLRIPANALWASTLLGLAWGVSCPDEVGRLHWPVRPVAGWTARAAAALVAAGLLSGAFLAARADWAARPEIERFDRDERPLEAQFEGLMRAVELWPLEARYWGRLAAARWQLARLAERDAARAAAQEVAGPDAPESVVESLAGSLLEARTASSTELAAAAERALAEAERAVWLAPGDRRWQVIRSMILSERPR